LKILSWAGGDLAAIDVGIGVEQEKKEINMKEEHTWSKKRTFGIHLDRSGDYRR
jgi:hypothetical protein